VINLAGGYINTDVTNLEAGSLSQWLHAGWVKAGLSVELID
jgi:hypothetical protein